MANVPIPKQRYELRGKSIIDTHTGRFAHFSSFSGATVMYRAIVEENIEAEKLAWTDREAVVDA